MSLRVRTKAGVVRRANISLNREPALTATRVAVEYDKMVYVLRASRALPYGKKKSRIFYIGTTKNGFARMAGSAAYRAQEVLDEYGVRSFDAMVVTCRGRQRAKMWAHLERALLTEFREMFDDKPKCNVHGKHFSARESYRLFQKSRLRAIIEELSSGSD
jgi:hypothetical protein